MVESFTLADKEKAVEDFMTTLGGALSQAIAEQVDKDIIAMHTIQCSCYEAPCKCPGNQKEKYATS